MASEPEPKSTEIVNAGETPAEKSWTESTTDKLGKVVHAAQDMLENAGEALRKAASESYEGTQHAAQVVGTNVAAAAETVAEYARDAKEHVVEAASSAADRLTGSGESETGDSPNLEPSTKRPKIQVQAGGPPPGLEANVDESLKGPQSALRTSTASPAPPVIKGPSARLLKAETPAYHKRANSSDKYWVPHNYE